MHFVHAQAFISRRNDSGTQRKKYDAYARSQRRARWARINIAHVIYDERLKKGEKLPRSQLMRVSLLP